MIKIAGGVCAPRGFTANGVHSGIRKNRSKRDLSLIVSECTASCAAVYTRNLVQGAPIAVTRRHIEDGLARAVLCNSGNANTCNADGEAVAEEMCVIAAEALGLAPADIVVASTGVIGQPMPIAPIRAGMAPLVAGLGAHSDFAAEGIMTTDTTRKEVAYSFTVGGKECRIGGIAKGSGMIHPNLATMLVFVTTDAAVSSEMLKLALSRDVESSFNMISVDGDTSTNDMVTVLANGKSGAPEITAEGEEFDAFCEALAGVTKTLCRMIAADGEGATKLLECRVSGAKDEATAKVVAKSIVCSSLVKAAMFGADANWGRVLCAIGYSGADVSIPEVGVSFVSRAGTVEVCRGGAGIPFSEEDAKAILLEREIGIAVSLGEGEGMATAWGCDLTYDYVKINGDYRT